MKYSKHPYQMSRQELLEANRQVDTGLKATNPEAKKMTADEVNEWAIRRAPEMLQSWSDVMAQAMLSDRQAKPQNNQVQSYIFSMSRLDPT